MFSRIVFIAALSLAPTLSMAATFHVRAGASGSNNGSDWANAWNSLSAVNYSVVNPGDTIYIAAGNYGGFSITDSGTAGSPITFKRATVDEHGSANGWANSYDGRVIVDGGKGLFGIGIGEAPAYGKRSYITIDGASRYGIWIRNADYGIRAGYGTDGLTLRNLEIGDAGTYHMGEDGIQGKGNDLLIENCFIHDNDSAATHGDGIQWFEGNRVTIRYNVWKNNGQQIYLGEGAWENVVNDVDIYYNVIYNRGGGHYNGIVMYGNGTQSGRYINVYNNTIDLEATDNSGFNSIFYPLRGNATINFKNNAVTYSNAGQVVNVNHSYNGYDNAAPYVTWSIPSTETGRVVAADLGFVNMGAADYHLAASSPLIGKGVNLGLTRDFDGKPVPSNPSIGAFEYGSAAPSPTPTPTATVTPTPTPTVTSSPSPTPTAVTGLTLLTTQVPALLSNSDGAGVNYELGMRFSSSTSGQIKAIRFYKSSSETGVHTGKIWSSTGTLLASVTFSSESASGWQQQTLSTPLNISAGSEYVVSVNTGNTYYVATNSGFVNGMANGSLSAPGGSNGVYGSVGQKPAQSWQSSNYFRDVVFVSSSAPAPSPTPTPTSTATPADTVAPKVSVTSPANGAIVSGSTMTITASASDNVGVARVRFLVNGSVKCTDTVAPYSCTVPIVAGQSYSIRARAFDAAGNLGSSALISVKAK